MSSVLVNGLTDVFKSQVAGPFASKFGESESSSIRGFETGIGAMLMAMRGKIGQAGFVRQLSDLINSPASDPRILDNARTLVGPQGTDGVSNRFLSTLFGNKLSSVSNAIGNASGLRPSSASGILSVGAPLLLGMLGRHVREGGMDASRLTSFITNEAEGIRGDMPRGIEGVIGERATAPVERSTVPPLASSVVRDRGTPRWPLLLVALAILAGLFSWLATRGGHRTTAYLPAPTPPAVTQPAPTQPAPNPSTGFASRELPGNVNLHIPPGGMEDHLLQFIQDPTKAVDNTSWFEFDRLRFDTNSAALQPGSQEQLRNIAAILKAYPNVHIKIGGYTDSTGNAAANMKLSQQRADAVKQQLVDMGISPDRMEAQGYDAQHPVANNTTEEGRQQNRRIAILVTQK